MIFIWLLELYHQRSESSTSSCLVPRWDSILFHHPTQRFMGRALRPSSAISDLIGGYSYTCPPCCSRPNTLGISAALSTFRGRIKPTFSRSTPFVCHVAFLYLVIPLHNGHIHMVSSWSSATLSPRQQPHGHPALLFAVEQILVPSSTVRMFMKLDVINQLICYTYVFVVTTDIIGSLPQRILLQQIHFT